MYKVKKSWSNVKKSWSDIEIIFQKRHNMLTKLIDSVSGYIKDENGVIVEITQLQSIWELIPQDDIQFKINISNKITASLKSIFAVAEKYPDLKADKNFQQLQQSITELETELANKGEEYNNNVNIFNKKNTEVSFKYSCKESYKNMQVLRRTATISSFPKKKSRIK
jgi:LemA protein